MDSDIAKALNALSKKIVDIEQKLDSYFLQLHKENSDAIDEILISMLEDKGDVQ